MDSSVLFPDVLNRFLKYVSFNTQSNPDSSSCPSTASQLPLGQFLVDELLQLGLTDARITAQGYVYASLPANAPSQPSIGFIAHMDTSPDAPGNAVSPAVVTFNGDPILLNAEKQIFLSPAVFPELNHYNGQQLVVTNALTLLGADDKAGIAEIISALAYLTANPQILHGKVCVAFTPDEEIGRGADAFDVPAFGADFAYTMDGGEVGELEYENFNAAAATVHFQGIGVHPGSAKNRMVNASLLAMQFQSLLPPAQTPEHTEGREGFFHLTSMSGSVEQATLSYIIRDHSLPLFQQRKQTLLSVAAFMQQQYGKQAVSIQIEDQYFNMLEQIKPVMHIVERARKAMLQAGVQPVVSPIRGGTDGAQLSFKGLPCPNIFAGGLNFHGRFEFLPVSSLHAAVRVIISIVSVD